MPLKAWSFTARQIQFRDLDPCTLVFTWVSTWSLSSLSNHIFMLSCRSTSNQMRNELAQEQCKVICDSFTKLPSSHVAGVHEPIVHLWESEWVRRKMKNHHQYYLSSNRGSHLEGHCHWRLFGLCFFDTALMKRQLLMSRASVFARQAFI